MGLSFRGYDKSNYAIVRVYSEEEGMDVIRQDRVLTMTCIREKL